MAAVEEEKKARESRLQLAIANDDVDGLHNLLVEEQELLDRVSKRPFPHTPLHIAAANGKTDVAMELAILRPSFARKLNPEGYSPMHLALQNKSYDIVRALMTLNPKLIRVQGRYGITPLHFVAMEKGDDELLELLAEFLFACKSSIKDLTYRRETAVHVAAKNHNSKALMVLFGWLKRVRMTKIVHWKDKDGNTVFDFVAPKVPQLEQLEQQNLEQPEIKVSYWITKEDAKEALEFFRNLAESYERRGRGGAKKNAKHPLSDLLSMELTVFEKFTFSSDRWHESTRNIILTVSTFIATATYQAALSPPGGYWGDNSSKPAANSTVVTASSSGIAVEKPHQAGNIILNGSDMYLFIALNSLIFLASIGAISITAVSLFPRSSVVFLLMWFLCISYYATTTIEFPKSESVGDNLIVGIYGSLQAVMFLVPLILCLSFFNFRLRMEAKGRHVDDFLEWKDRK